MISKERMNYESTRLFALTELIDTTHTIAYDAVNEGSGHYEQVLQRVHELLFAAFEVAHSTAHDLSDLLGECEADQPRNEQQNTSGTGEVVTRLPDPSSVPDDSLYSLGLPTFAANVLLKNGIITVGQLTSQSTLSLLEMEGVGPRILSHIRQVVADKGLALAGENAR